MECNKVQGMITQFINNKLSLKEMEVFIDHVEGCPECREELEVYYALLTAMRQLDEDKNLTSDFHKELKQKLEQSKEKIFHAKFTYYRKKVILLFTILLLAVFISFRYASEKEEYIHPVEQSDFHIRVPFQNGRTSMNEMLLQEYLKEYNQLPVPIEAQESP